MAPCLLFAYVAVAVLPDAVWASSGICAAALGDCPPITDASGEQDGLDDAALLQVARTEKLNAEASVEEEFAAEGSVEEEFAAEASVEEEFAAEAPRRSRVQMTVVTWNLGLFQRATPTEIAKVLAQSGADVIGTNEDVEFIESSQENALSIPGYTKVVACRAEALWTGMPSYPLGGRWLQNAIYIRDDTVTWVRKYTKNISNPDVVGDYVRCMAVADLRLKKRFTRRVPVRVASVHHTGGRFVDTNFLTVFNGEKGHEVREAARVNPDVLMGDFNSYPSQLQVDRYQQSYEPYLEAKKNGQLEQYYGWATEGTQEAFRAHYRRVRGFKNTTAYGGTVDHIFLRRAAGILVGAKHMSPQITEGFTMSDHDPVSATLILGL